tara:strand:+ start:7913 stop:8869 length:957 start_codon:yes stop_codon:yes gene_type:complete
MKDQLLKGDIRALSKAITLIESKKPEHKEQAQALLKEILPHTGKSKRIGISGVPGVGKSTFIEQLGLMLCGQNLKVAVLAVDPSSPISGGSIMGDKTRMESLSRHPNAFVRPSPTSGALGGVERKTRESMLLCEAAGFDIILVETVGVGQSEVAVSNMVDIFSVMLVPGAGDDLQGIKKGIIELADLLVINKADGDQKTLADMAKSHYQSALSLLSHKDFWQAQVLTCSARDNIGLDIYWKAIEQWYLAAGAQKLESKRKIQAQSWLKELLSAMIEDELSSDPNLKNQWQSALSDVASSKQTPYQAANQLLKLLRGQK